MSKSNLRLLADNNISNIIVNDIKKMQIKIDAIHSNASDEDICKQAIQERKVIITTNATHFWNDDKCKIEHTYGIIILAFDPSEIIKIREAFNTLWKDLLKRLPREWLFRTKIKISENIIHLKWIGDNGKKPIVKQYNLTKEVYYDPVFQREFLCGNCIYKDNCDQK